MAQRGTSRDYRGWTARGRAKAERVAAEHGMVPTLPDRVSTLELGERKLTFNRGGRIERKKGDDMVKARLIERALSGDFRSVQGLYQKLDAEEDKALAEGTKPLSPRVKAMLHPAFVEALTEARDLANELVMAGLAVWTGDRFEAAPEIVAQARARQTDPTSL